MSRFRNVFESEVYHGAGLRAVSKAIAVTIVLSIVSLFAAIGIVSNFDEITARIAIFMANLLSSGALILLLLIAAIGFVVRMKWKIHRNSWRW